ncbi:MAG: T9SS type A sorting domain-containing protein [Candidatus Symbiothrix sp.]|jgi:hypothetical protein|nr:T9SS type A sorting domain-containing protein [Candidatus Symbiothrix sp.]
MKAKTLQLSIVIILTINSLVNIQAQENQFLGPAYGAGIVREISHNGQYIVGQTAGGVGSSAGYVWDTQSGTDITVLPTAGEAFGVTDNRFIVGSFSDDNFIIDNIAIRSAGYVESGATVWSSLGTGLIVPPISTTDGSFARNVSADGSVIVGSSGKYVNSDKIYVPYAWTKNEQSQWVGEEWASPEEAGQCVIIDIADNGQTAVGYYHDGSQRNCILWKSKTEYILPFQSNHAVSEYFCISANGKYAGFKMDGKTGVQDLETNEIQFIPNAFLVNDITDNGMAVGIYHINESVYKAYIWHPVLGFVDLADFVRQYTQFNPANYDLTTSSNLVSINAISPDGLHIPIQVTTTGTPRQAMAYVLHLAEPIRIYPYPKNLSATVDVAKRNEITLRWEAPDEADEALIGYAIFRNASTPVDTVEAGITTYINSSVSSGYHTYKVKALYAGGSSNYSNITDEIVIANNYNFFRDTFSGNNGLKTNYWTTAIEEEESAIPRLEWRVYNDVGVEDGWGLYLSINNFNGVENQSYSATLQSKYLDGRTTEKVYLSFLSKADYYLESTLTPDTLFTDVFDGEQWINVDKSIFSLITDWKADYFDISPVAAGKLFQVRFRLTGENKTVSAKYFSFDDITITKTAPNANAPFQLIGNQSNDSVRLAWQNASSEMYALTYANSPKRYSIGNLGVPFIAVNRYDASDLAIYQNKYLHSITAYINQKVSSPTTATSLSLAVYENDERIVNQPVSGYTANDWNTFVLEEPILINGQNLKFGIEVVAHDEKEEPIGADGLRNPVSGKGDLYWDATDNQWHTLYEAKFVNNWCIIGNVTDNLSSNNEWSRNVVGYNVYLDGKRLNDYLLFGQSFLTPVSYLPEANPIFSVRAYSEQLGLSGEAVWQQEVSIKQPNRHSIQVYPNPVQDVLYFDSASPVYSVSIYDVSGRRINFVDRPNQSINTKDWNKGVYLIKIATGEGEIVRKIVKN